jgi:hypothetical protein
MMHVSFKLNFKSLQQELSMLHQNLRGLSSNDKIIVFESDDWGSTRMPNKQVYDTLLRKGIPVDRSAYCKYDTLESTNDIAFLAEVFSKYRNSLGVNPKLTMNYVSSNPDFRKINDSGREVYFFEPFTQTYKKSSYASDAFGIVQKGINEGLFMPQFHGRDHVNVPLWFYLLKNNEAFKIAFEHGMWGLSRDVFPQIKKSIQATYDSTDLNYTMPSIFQGLELFEKQFGFKSKSFIANNYVWANELNETLKNNGIVHFQTMKYQLLPNKKNKKKKMIRRTFGSKNDFGQTFAPRNCAFEPTEFGHDHLYTLKQISRAFLYKKPAIISSHRINFVGGLYERKRDENLLELDKLIKKIIECWPEVKFLSSDQLHDYILNRNSLNF